MEMHKLKAAEAVLLRCGRSSQQLRHGGFEGRCTQSAAESLPGAPGSTEAWVLCCSLRVHLPCPGELLPEYRMFMRDFAVAFCLPPIQLHKGLFLSISSPPRAQAMVLRGKEPPVALRLPHSQRKSQNYRTIRFGRNFWRSPSLTSLPRQGHRLCRNVSR